MLSKKSSRLPAWDLTDLYTSSSDPSVEKDVMQVTARAKKFAGMYRGKLARLASKASDLRMALAEYEAILEGMDRLSSYAYLQFAGDSSREAHGAFLQRMRTASVSVQQTLLFFELSLTRLPAKTVAALMNLQELQSYRNFFTKLTAQKTHLLSEAEETIIADKNLTGHGAFVRLFDQEAARKIFHLGKGRKARPATQAQVLSLLSHPRQTERKKAAMALTTGLEEELPRATYIMNVLVQDKAISDQRRSYTTPDASRHLDNQVDAKVVTAMVEVVKKHYFLVHDFYALKRSLLGVKKMYDFDRYAPILREPSHIPFRKARQLVLGAFAGFSAEFAEQARQFFDQKWIDAESRPGKASGAFCSYVGPHHHPYVLTNYQHRMEDVSVLAHELGHGVHGMLAREQSYLNFDSPLILAELASVFGEMLLFDHLKLELRDQRLRLALYVETIDRIIATIFRQTTMYRFEQDVHRLRREKGELPVETINSLWRARQQEMMGNAVILTENYDVWWSYIPHFIHTPFYVYAYAFGELLTLSLYARYLKDKKSFVPVYLDILRAGGSQAPATLLQPLRISLDDPEFWKEGMEVFEQLLSEMRELV